MSDLDWPIAWASLRQLDGAEWDAESERLDVLWKAEYLREFLAYALTRNWTEENSRIRSSEIVDDALATYHGAASSEEAARIDVREREWETINAG